MFFPLNRLVKKSLQSFSEDSQNLSWLPRVKSLDSFLLCSLKYEGSLALDFTVLYTVLYSTLYGPQVFFILLCEPLRAYLKPKPYNKTFACLKNASSEETLKTVEPFVRKDKKVMTSNSQTASLPLSGP